VSELRSEVPNNPFEHPEPDINRLASRGMKSKGVCCEYLSALFTSYYTEFWALAEFRASREIGRQASRCRARSRGRTSEF
jgi:hypothetical protein